MNTIVPLISSGVAGPLGVLHLPRLWLKTSLEARGKLAAGYPGCGKGFDQMVLDGLGLAELVRRGEVSPRELVLAAIERIDARNPQLNAVIHKAQDAHPHPSHAGRQLKMYYGTQVRSDPPTFMIYVNEPKLMHFTYIRYLENQIREEYGFLGTPIRIVTKGRRE